MSRGNGPVEHLRAGRNLHEIGGIVLLTIFKVSRKPSPVMLRQIRIEPLDEPHIACPTSDTAGSLDLFRDSVWAIRFQCIEQCQGVEKRLPSSGDNRSHRDFPVTPRAARKPYRQNNLAGESAILLAASRRAGPVELTLSAKTP